MSTPIPAAEVPGLVEDLAAAVHDSWSHWMRWQLDTVGVEMPDGSIILPADSVKRWRRQMRTPYARLNLGEQQSDRTEVNGRLLPVLRRYNILPPEGS